MNDARGRGTSGGKVTRRAQKLLLYKYTLAELSNVHMEHSPFEMKEDLINAMLSFRVQNYFNNMRSQLCDKLKLSKLEVTEDLNISTLLMSSPLEDILE